MVLNVMGHTKADKSQAINEIPGCLDVNGGSIISQCADDTGW